jgi:hypothetical protein
MLNGILDKSNTPVINNFLNAKEKLIEQAQNALYSVYCKIRNKKNVIRPSIKDR